MSAQDIIDGLKSSSVAAVRNQAANDLRAPIVRAVMQVAEAYGRPVDAGIVCCALTFVLSDFLLHHYPEALREPMLAAQIRLLERSVRGSPSQPL